MQTVQEALSSKETRQEVLRGHLSSPGQSSKELLGSPRGRVVTVIRRRADPIASVHSVVRRNRACRSCARTRLSSVSKRLRVVHPSCRSRSSSAGAPREEAIRLASEGWARRHRLGPVRRSLRGHAGVRSCEWFSASPHCHCEERSDAAIHHVLR